MEHSLGKSVFLWTGEGCAYNSGKGLSDECVGNNARDISEIGENIGAEEKNIAAATPMWATRRFLGHMNLSIFYGTNAMRIPRGSI